MSTPHLPQVVLVGRTSVGKSSLWNRLTESGGAVVSEEAHTTRDRKYGTVLWQGVAMTIVDTGGLDTEDTDIGQAIQIQAAHAQSHADLILFVIDGQTGVTAVDQHLATQLRKLRRIPVWLVANKIDHPRWAAKVHEADVYRLGLGAPHLASAATGYLVGDLLDEIYQELTAHGKPALELENKTPLHLALVGRPNVGKSSIINSILGEERVIVSPTAHTTREPQDTEFSYKDHDFLLIDTAGMRRQSRIDNQVETAGVNRNLRAIEDCDVACVVFDVTIDPSSQDRHLAGLLKDTSKGVILVANKWDLVTGKVSQTAAAYEDLIRQLFPFLDWAPLVFTSAKDNQRTRTLLDQAIKIQAERERHIDYNALNRILKACIKSKRPLQAYGPNSPRIYDAAQIAHEPPTFLVTIVGEKDTIHKQWLKFFERKLRDKFGFQGTAIVVKARNVPVSKSSSKHNIHGPGYEAAVGKIKEAKPKVNQTRRRQKI